MRWDIPSGSGRMRKGLQQKAAAVEAGVLPVAVPLPPKHHGPEDTQDVHLAQGGCGEGDRIMSYMWNRGCLACSKWNWGSYEFHILITIFYCLASPHYCLHKPTYARLPLTLDIFYILEEYLKYVGESSFPWMSLLLKYHRTVQTWKKADLQSFTVEGSLMCK